VTSFIEITSLSTELSRHVTTERQTVEHITLFTLTCVQIILFYILIIIKHLVENHKMNSGVFTAFLCTGAQKCQLLLRHYPGLAHGLASSCM